MFLKKNFLVILLISIFVLVVISTASGNSQTMKILKANITTEIRNGNYEMADENILKLELDPSGPISLIFHNIYNKNIKNFGILNDYASNTRYTEISYCVLFQLWRELKNEHSQIALKEFCEIYKTLVEEIIDSINLHDDHIAYANAMLTDIRKQIQKNAVDRFSSALLANTYYEIQEIADLILKADESLFDEIICIVINDSYNGMRFRELLRAMWTHKFVEQKSAALFCIMKCLNRNMDNNPGAIMLIAYYFYKLKNSDDYMNLNEYKSKEVDEHIRKFPLSVQNLYFADKVCIRNIKSGDHIFSESPHNSYRHKVSLQLGGHINKRALWNVRPIDEFTFKFKNKGFKQEYLYTGNDRRSDERLVFTWVAKDNLAGEMNTRLIWHVSLHRSMKNEVIIKNVAYNEVLCLSKEKSRIFEYREYQDAVAKNGDIDDEKCRWTVDNCPNKVLFGSFLRKVLKN